MKNLLSVLFVFILTSASAQLEKGVKLAGLQTNLIVNDQYSTRTLLDFGGKDYGVSIVPTFGYAIQKNWLLGLQATIGTQSETMVSGTSQKTDYYTDLGIAPFTRYYFSIDKSKKLAVFGVGAIEIVNTHRNLYGLYIVPVSGYADGRNRTSNTTITPSIGAGLAYSWKKISVDASFSTMALRVGVYKSIR